jgi:single-strand DNA-binding protein
MASLNRVFLMGNLTTNPELRHIPSGTAVCELRLAVSERFKNREGQDVESVVYVDVVVWARQAETCAEHLAKGSSVMIDGCLQLDQWEKDGQKRSKLRVRADRVQFLGAPRKREDDDSAFPPKDSEPKGPEDKLDTPFDDVDLDPPF